MKYFRFIFLILIVLIFNNNTFAKVIREIECKSLPVEGRFIILQINDSPYHLNSTMIYKNSGPAKDDSGTVTETVFNKDEVQMTAKIGIGTYSLTLPLNRIDTEKEFENSFEGSAIENYETGAIVYSNYKCTVK